MFKKISAALLCVAIVASCSRNEKFTTVTGKVSNATNHKIEILFYKNGTIAKGDTVKLAANQQGVVLGSKTILGENSASTEFASKYFGTSKDSIVVVFNETYRVTHYVDKPATVRTKNYEITSPRNLRNFKSYTSTAVAGTTLKKDAIYTFKEEDFNFSKP